MRQDDSSVPGVMFVVVNWNQPQLTLDCLASLKEQNYGNFSVVLVDNGSEDDSVTAVRAAYPDVTVLENGRNLGIAGANNTGINHALKTDVDYVFLLNNDTTVDPDMLTHLVTVAESEPDIGITGPTMLYFDQPDVIWCAGNSVNWNNGDTWRLDENSPLSILQDATCRDVNFITSCAVLIKREIFDKVGLMDERFFIYYDETDWFYRATEGGWRSVHVPWAKMWHKVSATMGEFSPTTDYYMVRNNFLYLSKNLKGFKRVKALTLATIRNIKVIAAYTLKNRSVDRLRNRNAKALALRDAFLQRWGQMGNDVKLSFRVKNS
ncbi:MAG: glycosyltransferase family 2 protein [Chloroflexi bacterium]|nr:MAG: glycosyltransferase family 2 protein [Chloroflexota bacterium]